MLRRYAANMWPTAVRTVRHTGELGSWELSYGRPHAALRDHVTRYLGYVESTTFTRRREAPSDAVPLILNLGQPLRVGVAGGNAVRYEWGFIAGLSDTAGIVDSGGEQTGLQVDFTPIGARLFLGIPMRAVAHQIVPLDAIFGVNARQLVQRLRDAPSWAARFAMVDDVICQRFAVAHAMPPDLVYAWRRLKESGGGLAVETLATEIGCSRKHLTARFTEHIGLPPKTMARILRFHGVVAELDRRGGKVIRLGDLAAQHGYYDQAHMAREFRQLAGISPTEHLRRTQHGLGVIAD